MSLGDGLSLLVELLHGPLPSRLAPVPHRSWAHRHPAGPAQQRGCGGKRHKDGERTAQALELSACALMGLYAQFVIQGSHLGGSHPWGHRPTRRCHRIGPTRLMTWRLTKPLLRPHAPHYGQRGHNVGRWARSASTDATRRMARTRANDHTARTSSGRVRASSTVQSKRCTRGSSSYMLSLRHSIGHRSPFGTTQGGFKSVPYVRCYATLPQL